MSYQQISNISSNKKGSPQGSSLYSHYSMFATTIQVQKHSTIYGLPCTCVNPFAYMLSIYSVCPIFVINSNILAWFSIKRENIMLEMIIPGLCLQQIFLIQWHLICHILLHNVIHFFSFTRVLFIYLNGCNNYIFYIMFKSIR